MFFIIDIMPMLKVLKELQGTCDTCQKVGRLELIETCQCFRFFFIPLFKWHKQYYLRHSCGGQIEISEETAMGLMYGKVDLSNLHFEHRKQGSNLCKHCGQVLEKDFEYCPYCGQKR